MATQADVKTKLDELTVAKLRAEKERSDFASEVDAEAREAAAKAKAEVHAKHAARTKELTDAARRAAIAWQAEIDASASHEWEGRKVVRQVNVGSGYAPRYEASGASPRSSFFREATRCRPAKVPPPTIRSPFAT